MEGWWPESVKKLLGSLSLANRNGAGHKARRRRVGQLFTSAALDRYSPTIVLLVEALNRVVQVSIAASQRGGTDSTK